MTKLQIKTISIHQSSKVVATLWTLILFVAVVIPESIVVWKQDREATSILYLFLSIFIYWLVLYLGHACLFWFYNRLTKWVGGFELEVQELTPQVHPHEIIDVKTEASSE